MPETSAEQRSLFTRRTGTLWLSAMIVLSTCILYNLHGWSATAASFVFGLTASFFHAALFVLPGFLTLCITQAAFAKIFKASFSRSMRLGVIIFSIIYISGIDIFVIADNLLYSMYGFHTNGFVLNLLATPGGVASLGLTPETLRSAWFAIATVVVAIVFLSKWGFKKRGFTRKSLLLAVTSSILVSGCVEKSAYGIAELTGYRAIQALASQLPFYQPVTFNRLARRLGFDIDRHESGDLSLDYSIVEYPKAPLDIDTSINSPNIVWITAESLRWDLLTPRTMPATWQLSERSHRFERHYSGGNRTRMGMFSMFYGLEGPYWFSFLEEGVSPVLFDLLEKRGYDLEMFTSAAFSYPEFDQTIFRSVPTKLLHEFNAWTSRWRRDEFSTTALLKSLDEIKEKRPFMRFVFFESTHAPYDFPTNQALEKTYLPFVDYTSIEQADAKLLKNRYVNAARFVDSQIQRIIDYLRDANLLQQTIIVITGDHGESFMEHGRWGHGSDFTNEQIRVPLVLHIPGTGTSVYTAMSSHMDIIPTLLPHFGVLNAASDYSSGGDLLSGFQRSHTIVSDWSGIAYVDSHYKVRVPLKTTGMFSYSVTTANDLEVPDTENFYATRGNVLMACLRDLQSFTRAKVISAPI